LSVGPGWSAFDHRFGVETPVPALDRYLGAVFGDLPEVHDAEHLYRLEQLPDGRWVTRLDGEIIDGPGPPSRAVGLLLWRVNRGAIEGGGELVFLHAGGVVIDGAGVVLAGDMEFGKSTLVAGLLCSGADYLTDEAVGLALSDDHLHGYARSLSLDEGSWHLFPELEPELPESLRPFVPHQWQIRASSIPGVTPRARAEPRVVVLPRYRAGASLAVRRLRGADALMRLSACIFPSPLPRRRILDRLARLLRTAPCYVLEHGDLDQSVEAVRDLLAADAARSPVGAGPLEGRAAADPSGSATQTTTRDDGRRPVRRRDATLLDVGDEWVLHVAATDEVHRLDALGVSLWERLDGRPVGQLIEEVTVGGTLDHEDVIAAKVRRFITHLETLRLVRGTGSAPPNGLRDGT
jgi:hypothetical protein